MADCRGGMMTNTLKCILSGLYLLSGIWLCVTSLPHNSIIFSLSLTYSVWWGVVFGGYVYKIYVEED
jgi:hypothetical protein